MKKCIFIILLLIFSNIVFAQEHSNVSVSITNISSFNSKLYVALYNNNDSFKLKSSAVDSIILIPGKSICNVEFKNIKNGTYAIAIFQDINNNGKLDTKKFKIPIEPVGISNYDENGIKLPPTFKKAKFNVEGNLSLTISIFSKKE